uniref:Probable beta-glucosidase M n=1 Tax=Talaromyces piceae TaxID=153982 RepID=A0A2D2AGX1_9EURO|nr:beta-glucosidase [Talaromyces piceae]
MWVFGSKAAFLLGVACVNAVAQDVIINDSYFYGDSPPVYPSPNVTGAGDWDQAYQKAKEFVSKLTQEEKVNLTAGVSVNNGCSGNIQPITRLNFPGMCVTDAGNGVRGPDFVNSWASGIHIGASWNRELALQRGKYLGTEFRAKGVNAMLGPVVGPSGRMVTSGRNWEGFSSDPYLTGALAFQTVRGVQSEGVVACTKHYIGNEQETNRNPGHDVDGYTVESVSSNIDDKTLHEQYLWPFQDAVHAGAGSIMCSYNRVNNSYGCQNSKLLNGILKTELGFQGYVMTDWGAQHGGIAAANAGLDVVMPNSKLWGPNLPKAIANGTMELSRLDDMITRLMASWYYLDQASTIPSPGIGMPKDSSAPHQIVNARTSSENDILWKAAVEGHVLVKNVNHTLPLKTPRLLSIFGYDASGDGQAREQSFGNASQVAFLNETLYVGGGSGANSPAYLDTPYAALQRQAYKDGTSLHWDFYSQSPAINANSDACLVFINSFATEGWDRPGLYDDYSDTLITNVANNCRNTIVVIHNAGIRLVNNWVDHANVTAVIFAHVPGQDTGGPLVDILYGRENPSGKLPYTVAKNQSDYGSVLWPSLPEGEFARFPQSNFTEGVYVDYKYFDKHSITPQYPFGYGLSYTTFEYSDLRVSKSKSRYSAYPEHATIIPGGNPHLFDNLVTVSVTVKNTGGASGQEVAQLYLGVPKGPVRQLRGFEKVSIEPGQSKSVQFSLTRRDLSVWDTTAQQWLLQKGAYKVFVGGSSGDLALTSKLNF